MAKIQVGSTTTTYGSNGEILDVIKKPSYLIQEDGTKIELSEEQAKKFGIGKEAD